MFDTIGPTLLKLGIGVAATAGLFLLIDTWLDDEGESSSNDGDENEDADLGAAKAAKAAKAAVVDDDEDDEDAVMEVVLDDERLEAWKREKALKKAKAIKAAEEDPEAAEGPAGKEDEGPGVGLFSLLR